MAIVPVTRVEYTGNGVTTDFSFPFDYEKEADVYVTVNDVNTVFTFATPNIVSINPAPVLGAEVVVYRDTPAETVPYIFENGVPFLTKFADSNWRQLLYSIQEFVNDNILNRLNFKKTLRTPDEVDELPDASGRADKLVGFDTTGKLGVFSWLPSSIPALDARVTALETWAAGLLVSLYSIIPRKVDSWSAIGLTPVVGAGQLFTLAQHTYSGLGGGPLRSFAGSVVDDGVTKKNSGTPGFYLQRTNLDSLTLYDAGVIPDGVTDNTVAVNKAFATGYNFTMGEGDHRITDKITMQSGQVLKGSGRTNSYFSMDATFNMAATCVLRLGGGEPGAEIYDIGFKFAQADQAVRANITQYPYAIDASSCPRFIIDRVRIEASNKAIKATGNAGGSKIGLVEIGCLTTGIELNGSADFIHGGHWAFWPFGMASKTNLMTVYYDGVCEAGNIGLVDGLNIDSLALFAQKFQVTASAGNPIPIQISKLQLDSDRARFLQAGGSVQIGVGYSTKTSAMSDSSVDIAGGHCEIAEFNISSTLAGPEVRTSGGTLKINGGRFNHINLSNPVARADGGLLILDGIRVDPAPNVTYTQPHFVQVAGGMQVKNCTWTDAGSGTGIAIFYSSDNSLNTCTGNNLGNWQYAPPAITLPGNGIYTRNANTASGAIIASSVQGELQVRRLTGVADGAGNFSVAHSIASGNLRVLSVSGYYKGASSEMRPMTTVFLDGANVSMSGATAGATVRLCIIFTSAAHSW